MERAKGFEPSTSTLARWHSTTELRPLTKFIFGDFFLDVLLTKSAGKKNEGAQLRKSKNNLQCSIANNMFWVVFQPVSFLYFQSPTGFFLMMISKKFSAVFAILLLTFSTACVETVVIGTAATATMVLREKTLDNTRQDVTIATKLGAEFIKNGLKNPGNSIDITVNEGRILLTGIARDPQKAKLAADLAWKTEGVKEVIDEIQMGDDSSLRPRDFSKAFFDYGLSLRAEAALLFGRDIASVNYKITTVNGVVYLLGVASNDEELQNVLAKVSKIRGVKKIVNYVILSNDSRRRG